MVFAVSGLGLVIFGGGLVFSFVMHFAKPGWISTDLILIAGFLAIVSMIGFVIGMLEHSYENHFYFRREVDKKLESISRFTDEAREYATSGELARPLVDSVNEVTRSVNALRDDVKR
jgi:hypothetical protein